MKKEWLRPLLGRRLLVALGLALLSGCRESIPPKIEICILNGFGGASCELPDGSQRYRPPSEMNNYWATNESDQARFAAWCYDTELSVVQKEMAKIQGRRLP